MRNCRGEFLYVLLWLPAKEPMRGCSTVRKEPYNLFGGKYSTHNRHGKIYQINMVVRENLEYFMYLDLETDNKKTKSG